MDRSRKDILQLQPVNKRKEINEQTNFLDKSQKENASSPTKDLISRSWIYRK